MDTASFSLTFEGPVTGSSKALATLSHPPPKRLVEIIFEYLYLTRLTGPR